MCLTGISLRLGYAGQTVPEQKEPLAEDVFKNVQVLRGASVSQFMATMGFFSASLGDSCEYCHVPESVSSWAKYAEDNEHKQTARKMVIMVNNLNRANFGGRRVVTCYSCHQGGHRPKVIPSLAKQYAVAPDEEPDEIPAQAPAGVPPADQVLDKYIEAVETM